MLVYFTGSARDIKRDIEIYRSITVASIVSNSYASGLDGSEVKIYEYENEEVVSVVKRAVRGEL